MAERHLRGYQIQDKIGSGGMATVYRAQHRRSRRIIALKMMHPHLAKDPAYVERFRREARTAKSLAHPNIVRVLDLGEDKGDYFLVMEYVRGKTLAELIREKGALPIDLTLSITSQVAQALNVAHRHGIVHRDIKPQNLMVTPDGTIKVMDFGIAKAAALTTVTHTGMFLGSPQYVSPEQAKGARTANIQSDIYSLGVVMYEMLAGSVPFHGETPMAILRQHLEEDPPPLHSLRADVPAEVEEIVVRAMARNLEDRYLTPEEMMEDLRQLTTEARATQKELATLVGPFEEIVIEPRKRFPRFPVWAVAAAVVALLLVSLLAIVAAQNLIPMRGGPVADATATGIGEGGVTATMPGPNASPTSVLLAAPPPEGMVLVPAGEFLMGSDDEDFNAQHDETPQRSVYLDAFFIDIFEVTNQQYESCVQAGLCERPRTSVPEADVSADEGMVLGDHPVVSVTWYDAQTYCEWLGKRLPSEAEWEKAARGTDGRIYPWGDDWDETLTNSREDTNNDPVAVGTHLGGASPYGVQDMAGNASEWVGDWYDNAYYAKGPTSNPMGPSSRERRVVRGGSWMIMREYNMRAADRGQLKPSLRWHTLGFRCAQSALVEAGSTPAAAALPTATRAATATVLPITPSPTKSHSYLQPGQTITDTVSDVLEPHIDVVGFTSTLNGETLEVTFLLRDIPPTLTFNRDACPDNVLEYKWTVNVDNAYQLSAMFFSHGSPMVETLQQALQCDVWELHAGGANRIWPASLTVDSEANSITLSGVIPGVSTASRLSFETFDRAVSAGDDRR